MIKFSTKLASRSQISPETGVAMSTAFEVALTDANCGVGVTEAPSVSIFYQEKIGNVAVKKDLSQVEERIKTNE